ncbi:MAG TPA: NfeD family protein [Rhodothermales bacterium]|nr:NfeD family protein [Rhodothermales bacterium]
MSLLPVILVLVGLALIVVEVYLIPGLNVIGIAGFLVVVFAVGLAFNAGGAAEGVALTAGALVLGGGVFFWMWRSGAWERFVLATSLRADEAGVQRESEARARYLGRSGTAITPLRPTGIVDIDGERIEVATEGEFIASGSEVRVVAMDRRRFFVRLSSETAPSPPVRTGI